MINNADILFTSLYFSLWIRQFPLKSHISKNKYSNLVTKKSLQKEVGNYKSYMKLASRIGKLRAQKTRILYQICLKLKKKLSLMDTRFYPTVPLNFLIHKSLASNPELLGMYIVELLIWWVLPLPVYLPRLLSQKIQQIYRFMSLKKEKGNDHCYQLQPNQSFLVGNTYLLHITMYY